MRQYGKYSGAVLASASLDVLGALCLLIEQVTGSYAWPKSGFTIEFWRSNEDPTTDQVNRWRKEKLLPININRYRYETRGATSATADMANRLELVPEEYTEVRRLLRMVDGIIANDPRWKTSAHHCNVPFLFGELFKPQMLTKHQAAIEAGTHAVFTFLNFNQLFGQRFPRQVEELKKHPKLEALLAEVPSSKSWLSIDQYAREMFLLGVDVDEISQRVGFWLSAYRRNQTLHKLAIERAESVEKVKFEVDGRPGVHVVTANERVARALFNGPKPPALVLTEQARTGGRHWQIQTLRKYHDRGSFRQSMERLTRHLNGLESAVKSNAKWQFDENAGAVFCGTRMTKDSSLSSLKASQVIKEIKACAKFGNAEDAKASKPKSASKVAAKTVTKPKAKSAPVEKVVEKPKAKPDSVEKKVLKQDPVVSATQSSRSFLPSRAGLTTLGDFLKHKESAKPASKEDKKAKTANK